MEPGGHQGQHRQRARCIGTVKLARRITSFYNLTVSSDSKKIYVITDLDIDDDSPSGLFAFTSTSTTAKLITGA